MYTNNFLNNTIQEMLWISLYRDIFLKSYRHLNFSISPSTSLNRRIKFACVAMCSLVISLCSCNLLMMSLRTITIRTLRLITVN